MLANDIALDTSNMYYPGYRLSGFLDGMNNTPVDRLNYTAAPFISCGNVDIQLVQTPNVATDSWVSSHRMFYSPSVGYYLFHN